MKTVAIGVDLSTQSCKCVAVDTHTLAVVGAARVVYDSDLPQYATDSGVHRDGAVVTSPPKMWADALRMCLDRLCQQLVQAADAEGRSVTASVISGSAQQHATVFVAAQFGDSWDSLDAAAASVAAPESPIWMDHSTTDICIRMTEALGGDAVVRGLTGSRATERFSVHHVVALREKHAEAFARTKSVLLASSFATSLLIGRCVGTDWSDAAGMNLMDIRSLSWSPEILSALRLDGNLFGPLVDPTRILADHVAPYWTVASSASATAAGQTKHVLSEARVVPFSGDNPCAVVGMGLLSPGDLVVSLGTSDTCMVVGAASTGETTSASVNCDSTPFAHTFPHPLHPRDLRFHMLVYANGDLCRRRVRDEYCSGSWAEFEASLRRTDADLSASSWPVDRRFAGIHWVVDEISPVAACPPRPVLTSNGTPTEAFPSAEVHVRAVVEFRALCMKLHLEKLGALGADNTGAPSAGKLLLTGGAAVNRGILQVFADVFQRDVHCLDIPDAAAVGAAYRGIWALLHASAALDVGCTTESFVQHITHSGKKLANPRNETRAFYAALQHDVATLLDTVANSNNTSAK